MDCAAPGNVHYRRGCALTTSSASRPTALRLNPKELFVVPGAGHVDLYDRVQLIPWRKLESFFERPLAVKES